MRPDQAVTMTEHLTKDFRGYGPGKAAWLPIITPLDFDRSFVAYLDLLSTCPERPSVAEFLAAYRATAPHEPTETLKGCGCDGWKTISTKHHGHWYEELIPCDCPAGRAMDHVYAKIVEFNSRQPWSSTGRVQTAPALEAEF